MKRISLHIFFVVAFIFSAFSQTDSLMSRAKEMIKNDNYQEAQKIYENLLDLNPTNNDVRFSLGLMFSWSKQYSKARIEFYKVLNSRKNSKEVYVAALNNEIWAERYDSALNLSIKAEASIPNDSDILIRKAKALSALGRIQEAKSTLQNYLNSDKKNREINDLLENITTNNFMNATSASGSIDCFRNQDGTTPLPWYWGYVQYKRKTNLGSIIGRINYSNRFGNQGFQGEIDAYPKIGKSGYAYINLGLSSASSVFPNFRMGLDYYQTLPSSFEASLGARYLDFTTSSVIILTGHIGKYLGNFWFSLRPYVVPSSTGTSVSGQFLTRLYFVDANEYLGVQFGYGVSPDDRSRLLNNASNLSLYQLNTKLSYNHIFWKRWITNLTVGYAYEEWLQNLYRNKYTIDVTLTYLF